jgi:hypothetical protein
VRLDPALQLCFLLVGFSLAFLGVNMCDDSAKQQPRCSSRPSATNSQQAKSLLFYPPTTSEFSVDEDNGMGNPVISV